MPRWLLRDGLVVADDWRYADEVAGDSPAGHPTTPLIVPLEQWTVQREALLARDGRLGVLLSPAHRVEQLSGDIARLALVAAQFPGPAEGRGYSQGRLLRERLNFRGELRATGYVRRDQLFFLARCGFNSFEMAEADLAGAADALSSFSAAYQTANDAGLAVKLPRHRPGTPASA